MMIRSAKRLSRWQGALAALAVLATVEWVAATAAAAEAAKLVASLELVPENVAFYSASLHNREKYEAIVNSRAWAKLKALPIVQTGMALYNMQTANPDSFPGRLEAALQDPEVQKTLSLAGDLVSEEVFCYGDQNVVDFVDLTQRLSSAMNYGPLTMQLDGKNRGAPANKLQAMAVLSALAKNAQLLKVPDGVLGFKVHDAAAVRQQLERLEKLVSAALEANPQLKMQLKKTEIGGVQYLTLTLDGGMIPWEEVQIDEFRQFEANKGDVDKIVARLKEMTLTVAIGLRGDFLLVSLGSSTDVLGRFGQGKHLAERPELAPLAKFADKRLTHVGYLSKAMAVRVLGNKKDIDQLLEAANALLPLANLPAAEQEQIRKDAAELAADLKTLIPDVGPMMSLGFFSDRGIEDYQYSWGQQPGLDASKPLTLLEHIGGNPALAVVNRGKVSVANYDRLTKWLGVGYRYFEKYGVPKIPSGDREKFEKAAASFKPLVVRLDSTTRDMLLPALADGQVGVVLDTKLSSKQFAKPLPATETPLRMLEPALVLGVSDAELLRKACTEYKSIINDMIDAARHIEGSEIPADFHLPDAVLKSNKKKGYTLFTYPLPEAWGVDTHVLPNAGLSPNVAVVTLSREHSRRLLAATPPTVAGRAIPIDQPQAAAGLLDFAGLIDTITPWIDLGVRTAVERDAEDEGAQRRTAMILDQAHTVLDVLKVVRTIVSQTYLEGDAMVSHTEIEIRDVAPSTPAKEEKEE
ncbi:MAG: hypothetical protein ACLQLG_12185 [Thermoguttaceae bacterium]